ncbi:putative elongation factor 1-gamma (EF-1-gamma) [Trypanosoma cruzi]|nr:putative elongation factor 1-gamma (EF-1-gamma) [Trypanosoma cruzi]
MQCMTVRLICVWLQRMQHVRQYALGVALMIGEERRHDVVALCVLRGRGMPAIVRDVEYTELLEWEEVTDVAAQRERMTAACGGRARRSRGLCWRGACWSERGVPVRA